MPDPVSPLSSTISPGATSKDIGPSCGSSKPLTRNFAFFRFLGFDLASSRPMAVARCTIRSRIGTSTDSRFSPLILRAQFASLAAASTPGRAAREIESAVSRFRSGLILRAAFCNFAGVRKAEMSPKTKIERAKGRASSTFLQMPSALTSPKRVMCRKGPPSETSGSVNSTWLPARPAKKNA